jgi:hypothetical protein
MSKPAEFRQLSSKKVLSHTSSTRPEMVEGLLPEQQV